MRIDFTTKPVVQKLRFCFNKMGLTIPVWFDHSTKRWVFWLNDRKIELTRHVALDFVEKCATGKIETRLQLERYFKKLGDNVIRIATCKKAGQPTN